MKFNVNCSVKVKLTELGEAILEERYDKLDEFIKSRNGKGLEYPFLVLKDKNGYTKFQLWDLMETFGPYVGLGRELPFETEIEIPEKHNE